MSRWIDNNIADRLYILDHVSSWKNITPESVEKDWWVTAVLKCMFELTAAPYMSFKGGTSLSKGWNLIDRFSEDIDIALYRDFFLNELRKSCAACTTNNQIMNLRKVSRDYVTTDLKAELEERLKADGLSDIRIEAVTTRQTFEGEKPIDHDSDPTVLNVHYKSILSPTDKYVRPVVKIEISCLSLKEICPSSGQNRNQLPLFERTISAKSHPIHHIRALPGRRYADGLDNSDGLAHANIP